jgi:cyclohexa-1,5-dienecarbonyl-CoA hydratase
MDAPIAVRLEEGGTLLRITLTRPPGNIIDSAMVAALRAAVRGAGRNPELRTILIDAEGKHFSFGASVEEHRPEQIEAMLTSFHALFRELLSTRRVLLGAVSGQCLGGGLELLLACHRIFSGHSAKLGNPEIRLGVFAPLSSAVLPLRIGQAHADDLLLTGRSVDAVEALSMGLVDVVADDPAGAALAWHREFIAPLSASSLRHAVRAARHHHATAVIQALEVLEGQYLEELMLTEDAVAGIESFLQKRPAAWTNK